MPCSLTDGLVKVEGTPEQPLQWSLPEPLKAITFPPEELSWMATLADGKVTVGLRDGTKITASEKGLQEELLKVLQSRGEGPYGDMDGDDDDDDDEEEEEEDEEEPEEEPQPPKAKKLKKAK
eukprot:RCo045003